NDAGNTEDITVSYELEAIDAEGPYAGVAEQRVKGITVPTEGEQSFKVVDVAPGKEAGLLAEDGSFEASEEIAQGEFVYRVLSSGVPANPPEPLRSWSFVDSYAQGARAIHTDWKVVADADIHDSEGEVVHAAGDVLATADDESLFTIAPQGDS